MLNLYTVNESGLELLPTDAMGRPQFDKAVWIDLLEPTAEEETLVESVLRVDIPTREEMRDLEESSRLYEEEDALFMTAVLVAGASQLRPVRAEATFVLTPRCLITLRYADPLPLRTFAQKCSRQPEAHSTSDLLLASLLEQIIQRVAELLDKITTDLDSLSADIFDDNVSTSRSRKSRNVSLHLQAVVKRLGRSSALLSKLRESSLSLNRMLTFLTERGGDRLHENTRGKLNILDRDVRSLAKYEDNLAAQISYLQEATFNLINIEQNRVIKVFTIAAVLFLPPTLIGTIYGMNFDVMPELKWAGGYPFALLLMVGSALVPFVWFRRNGWF